MPAQPVREAPPSSAHNRLISNEFLRPSRVELVSPVQNAASPGCSLPSEVADSVWRGDQLGRVRTRSIQTGFQDLDAELPDGGWPCGSLTEVLQSQPSLIEWRLIGPSLRTVVKGGRIVVIGPPSFLTFQGCGIWAWRRGTSFGFRRARRPSDSGAQSS